MPPRVTDDWNWIHGTAVSFASHWAENEFFLSFSFFFQFKSPDKLYWMWRWNPRVHCLASWFVGWTGVWVKWYFTKSIICFLSGLLISRQSCVAVEACTGMGFIFKWLDEMKWNPVAAEGPSLRNEFICSGNTIPNLWKGYEHIVKRLKGNTVYSWRHLLIPFCHLLFLVLSISLLKCNRILESQIICL